MYVVLRVDSLPETVRLVEAIRDWPHEDIRAPHWGDHVHAEVVGVFVEAPAGCAPTVPGVAA